MKHRKLRIAWSVAWGIAAVLLIVLWGRSFWLADSAGYTAAAESLTVSSQNGTITVSKIYERNGNYFGSRKVDDTATLRDQFSVGWFDERDQSPAMITAAFPHWLVTLPIVLIAIAPWVHWRLAVRRLLIVTACVGGLLSLVVCCSRH